MNLRLTHVVAAVAVLFSGGSLAVASPVAVSWSINSSKSSFTLKIPDQTLNISGSGFSVRVRNQNSGTAWNKGNTASIAGAVSTTWDPNPSSPTSPILAFTGSGLNIAGVNSGSYRPAISQYVGGTVNPDGTASGGNYSGSGTQGAVFASQAEVVELGGLLVVTAAYLSFYNTFFNVQSGNIPVAGAANGGGTGSGSFNGTLTNVGVAQSLIAFDGQPILGQTVIPDAVENLGSLLAANASAGGAITYGGPAGPAGWVSATLTLPVSQNISIDLGNNSFLTGTGTGTIVMTAIVPGPTIPEPSTLMIAGLGLVSLAVCARRKLFGR